MGTAPTKESGPNSAGCANHEPQWPRLLSPEWLAEMEEFHPGAVEIILRDFTEERQHLREMQRKGVELKPATAAGDLGSYQNRRLLVAGGLSFFLATCGLVLILLIGRCTGSSCRGRSQPWRP